MRFPIPLVRGQLIARYKRFLADVAFEDGARITAACPNTGAMLGLVGPGRTVWLSCHAKPSRKYPYTWEMVEADLGAGPTLVGINPLHPNGIVAQAIAAGHIPTLAGYASLRREVRYGAGCRIDVLLDGPGKPPCYVEVKNVHFMREGGRAEFPDSITARGAKQLSELTGVLRQGGRAIVVYLIQRADAHCLALADDIDPRYAAAFAAARDAGLEAIALRCRLSREAIDIEAEIPIAPCQ